MTLEFGIIEAETCDIECPVQSRSPRSSAICRHLRVLSMALQILPAFRNFIVFQCLCRSVDKSSRQQRAEVGL